MTIIDLFGRNRLGEVFTGRTNCMTADGKLCHRRGEGLFCSFWGDPASAITNTTSALIDTDQTDSGWTVGLEGHFYRKVHLERNRPCAIQTNPYATGATGAGGQGSATANPGRVTVGTAGYSSTRNQHLADIIESTPYENGFVAENRGTGFKLMRQELESN